MHVQRVAFELILVELELARALIINAKLKSSDPCDARVHVRVFSNSVSINIDRNAYALDHGYESTYKSIV